VTYFKVNIRLDEMTPLEPNAQGYPRMDTDTLADLTLTGSSEEDVLFQASKHVLTLHDAYESKKDPR
jgi:hypothetical protein